MKRAGRFSIRALHQRKKRITNIQYRIMNDERRKNSLAIMAIMAISIGIGNQDLGFREKFTGNYGYYGYF
jgi:hypothetical protein